MQYSPKYSWLDGNVIPWDQCVLHARTQAAFWGANVFEGVRAYWQENEQQLFLFRLQDHIDRLRRSMKCIGMVIEYSDQQLIDGVLDLVQANKFQTDLHIVIVGYFGMGENFDPMCLTEDTGVHITALPLGRSPRFEAGASACVSSWRRIGDDAMPPRIKTGANYHNSRLAQHEATRNGYDTALFLNQRGTIAEAPGSCVMMVDRGVLYTPPGTSGVLEGITVATISEIAEKQLGIKTVKRELDRTELYLADEAFLAGTLSEIQPMISLDRQEIGAGKPGQLTRKLQELYDRAVHGIQPFENWVTPVYEAVKSEPVLVMEDA